MTDFERELLTGVQRLYAAAMIELFGSAASRRAVERLLDHKLAGEEAEDVRHALDEVAGRLLHG